MATRNAGRRPDSIAELSRALLSVDPGERIPTFQTLQASIGVGSGTVVKALRALQDMGAVEVEAHGHQGSLLVRRDIGALWDISGLGALRVLLTPPGPVEQHAVSAAIRQTMNEQDVPLLIEYLPGAHRRLEAVATGTAHATCVSLGAYRQHEAEFGALGVRDLGDHTYYDVDSIVVVQRPGRAGAKPRTVGIDETSDDHATLTRAEFGDAVRFVPCSFVEGPAGVLQGRFDAVVWHRMPAIIPPELANLVVRPLGSAEVADVITPLSRAVMVVRQSDRAVNALFERLTSRRVRQKLHRISKAVGDSVLPHEALWLG